MAYDCLALIDINCNTPGKNNIDQNSILYSICCFFGQHVPKSPLSNLLEKKQHTLFCIIMHLHNMSLLGGLVEYLFIPARYMSLELMTITLRKK